MDTPPLRPVPPGAAGAMSDTEEGRSFFQDRLQLFAGWIFLISGSFLVAGTGLFLIFGRYFGLAPGEWNRTGTYWHLAGTLDAGAVWLLLRLFTLSAAALRRLDAIATILAGVGYACMGAAFALDESAGRMGPHQSLMMGLLACTYVVLSRAITLPSGPGRTAWISTVAMLPIPAATLYVFAQQGLTGVLLVVSSASVFMWAVACVVLAVLTSRIIFGLRTEAAQVRRLGQYTLDEKIGEGGMGQVYRAHHAMLRRPTAIKLLPPERLGEENIRRFEREVQLTAELTHPNTVAIFDYGRTPDGLFYYAMEYLDGLNLDQLVKEDGPQSPGRVVHILVQACGALAEAHRAGLVHGDIKPPNIILVDRGGVPDVVKVVDFGLVKRVDSRASDATMTAAVGTVLRGTPLYLSPEAIRNDPLIDGRSDLYALGAVGYYLLTGTPVFEADTVVEIFSHHLQTPPVPLSRRAPSPAPAALEAAIMACLAKDPDRRPRDAPTLQALLSRCPCDIPWSHETAAAWWVAYRARSRRGTQAATTPGAPTMRVDLGERMAEEERAVAAAVSAGATGTRTEP